MSDLKDATLYRPKGLRFWRAGALYAKGTLLDRKRHGRWEFWYENGQKQLEGEYVRGKKEGVWVKWNDAGGKINEGGFSHGKMNGKWTDWYKNGQKALESFWTLGRRDGTWTYWNTNGDVLKRETYKHSEERDLSYSIHTDVETKEIVKNIQRQRVFKTWESLVGTTVARILKPWHVGCWIMTFIPFFGLLKEKGEWRGVALSGILAFVVTGLVSWGLDKRNPGQGE